jgi:hypothetical protein
VHYYTTTIYYCHAMEMETTNLHGPFKTPEERAADIETKRKTDYWNLQEDTVTILLLDITYRTGPQITAGETLTPVDPAFEEGED